jgi:PhnB protein
MSGEPAYIQKGHRAITPYLYGRPELVDFVRRVFEAEVLQHGKPDESGRFHTEVKIGDSIVLIGSGYFSYPSMAAAIWVYVKDMDATYKLAIREGATLIREPVNESWGDRVAGVKDASGNTWWIATHKGPK